MSEQATPPVCPGRLVAILQLLAGIQRDLGPDTEEGNRITKCIEWLGRRIYQATGVLPEYTLEIVRRLARGITLEPLPDLAGKYASGVQLLDLSEILPRLHMLDVDGTTKELWLDTWRGSLIFREIWTAASAANAAADGNPTNATGGQQSRASAEAKTPAKPRRTERNHSRIKIIAVLSKHHEYAAGGCLNCEPIKVRDFERTHNIGRDAASRFFKKEFGEDRGHDGYIAACRDVAKLAYWLKLLNADYPCHPLFGRAAPGEGDNTQE